MANFAKQIEPIKSWDMLVPDQHEAVWNLMLHLGLSGASIYAFSSKDITPATDKYTWQDRMLARLMHDIRHHTVNSAPNPMLDVDRTFEKEICQVLNWNWQEWFIEPAEKEHAKTKGKKK